MEKTAFEEHYKMVYQDLYRFALYILRNEADAEDAVAEAVADAWKGLKNLREEYAFRKWIFKILRIKCKKKQMDYCRHIISLDEQDDMFEPWQKPDFGWDEAQDVQNAFWRLEAEERLIVSMSVFGGYTSQEIGEALELKSTTVRSKLSRSLSKMQARLEV